jgi:hypothetical protein
LKAIDGVDFSNQAGINVLDAVAPTDVPSYQQLVDLGIPPAGLAGEALVKATATDYDAIWQPLPAGTIYTGGDGINIDGAGLITAVGDVARGIDVDALGIFLIQPIHLEDQGGTAPTPPLDGQIIYSDGGSVWVMGPDGVAKPLGGALKYAADIGDGTATAIAVAHNLNSTDIVWSLKDTAGLELVAMGAVVTDANTLTLTFPAPPAAAAYRVVVMA